MADKLSVTGRKVPGTKKRVPTTKLAMIGAMTAVICVLAPVSIPLPMSPVPISLTSLVLFMVLYALGWKAGSVSYGIYLLVGILGLPVFSGFGGGVGKLAGPTGGYLIGFIFTALVSGWMLERYSGKMWLSVLGMVLGMLVTYLIGTIWLMRITGTDFVEALAIGVIPFLPGDILKICVAAIAGPAVRKRLSRAGVL